jgi:hypothetical protein
MLDRASKAASYTRRPMDVTPALVLSMWAAGVGAGAANVARWRIVGPGFAWLSGGVTLLLGIPAAATAGGVAAWTGVVGGVLIVLGGRRWGLAVIGGSTAAVCFAIVSALEGYPVAAVSGAVFLGAVTSEMMLGHWFLVDPRLPRWSLRRLAWIGVVASVVDLGVLAASGVVPWDSTDAVIGIGYLVLALSSSVLMLAVIGALREEGYSGVMAATGLSYLALLTSIGAAVLGRLLLGGPVLG